MKINTVVVIGAGTMGQGIAQWMTQQNLTVEMVDQNFEFATLSLKKIFDSFDKLASNGKIQTSDVETFKKNITVKKLEEIDRNADLIIEAIIEDVEAKKKLFRELDQMVSTQTVFASNTSSFPITMLASAVPAERKERFIGLHFFNPATIMKLVEVIPGLESNRSLIADMLEWFNSRRKIACECSDSPGFIVNRVARNFYGEALRSAGTFNTDKFSEIDTVMKEIGGFKMGPFELMDMIGIDINYSVTMSVYEAFFHEARFKPHRLQQDMVSAGRLGKKTGKGFFNYESK